MAGFWITLMIKTITRLTILLLLLLSALIVACSPGGIGSGDPAADGAIPFLGESAESDTTTDATPPVVAGGAAEVDAAGIPVGFTDEGRPYRGDLNAPIVMEAFSDFQCPYCSRFTNETLPGILESQIANGEVLLVFYDFPLNSIHPQAAAAANAARCAGESGPAAYWAMHDRLFVNLGEWSNNNPNDVFLRYAEELGIADNEFAGCLAENRYAEEVAADLELGRSRGVSSTPSFFLNQQPVIGAYPLEYFNQAFAAVAAGDSVAAQPEAQPQAPAARPTPVTIAMDDVAFEIGDPDAPVTIVEYTDYQCPYCARHAAQTLPQMLAEMVDTGRVRYVIKDFPLDSIHPEARAASVAARCAGEQGQYWEMHDALFTRQGEWGGLGRGAAGVFASMAADLSMDEGAFAACMDSGRYDQAVQDNQDEGISFGINGTPAFFIDGYPISGAQPYELFEYAIGLAEEGTLADAYVSQQEQAQAPAEPSAPVEVDVDGAYSIGDPDAPVTVVEFTDFQCPFCSRHFIQTFPQIQAEYIDTGKVRYVFMDFPLSSIHPQAQLAAEAARCAGDQGEYVAMHHILFERQDGWNGRQDAADIFADYAGELGLDSATFAACLDSGVHEQAVIADLDYGASLGVDGTPAFFVGGTFISGAQPFEVFQQAIEAALAEAGG